MRAICATSAAALTAAALALAAPTATAVAPRPVNAAEQTTPLFTVSPQAVVPGGRVLLSASGCATTATASSGLFDAVTIQPGTSARVTVAANARPGTQHSVQFTCGSQRGTFILGIAGGSSSPTISSTGSTGSTGSTDSTGPTVSASAPATPLGVRGGLGGSVGEIDAGEVAVGAVLVLTALGAATVLVRRRTPEDPRH
ncbi:hypothetical protein I3J09_01740 [Streptomyces clavuligerus]|nr:hypothetical protein BB341_01770 [Streptomyces clavuligerus]AXU16386.1 hypothetical protein D1794_01865 [Streptomyces clavuligerus]MBY6301402.1 hypothetical protein [Streptomyces clavuligerus]QPL66376.1 hypothetical protein I3J04_01740 [Streptomyces clavuligerus]QPL72407.1 hypothetical protein I3J05_01755 [Streptomyces clavuligerus]